MLMGSDPTVRGALLCSPTQSILAAECPAVKGYIIRRLSHLQESHGMKRRIFGVFRLDVGLG